MDERTQDGKAETMTEKQKEMQVKEGVVYTIGEFDCPVCHTHHLLKCNPKGRTKKHWVE